MLSNILKKLLSVIPLLLIISIVLFILINALPGDATMSMIGETADEEYVAQLREKMGLDKPVVARYFSWLADVLRGDLGESLVSSETVAQKIKMRLPITLEITLVSMLISVLIALPLGVLSAVKRGSAVDTVGSVVSMLGVAMPSFWLGLLLVMYFSVQKGLLPASGFTSFSQDPVKNLRCIILPCVSIGFGFAATVMRQTRSSLLEVLQQDYIMTAQAKGLRNRIVIWKHAMRNALIPVLTVTAMQIGRLIGGAVVTETVFGRTGLGQMTAQAVSNRDTPVLLAIVLIAAAAYVVINLIVDLLYPVLDVRLRAPRTRSASPQGVADHVSAPVSATELEEGPRA